LHDRDERGSSADATLRAQRLFRRALIILHGVMQNLFQLLPLRVRRGRAHRISGKGDNERNTPRLSHKRGVY
jgi:hypothetical protein